MADDNTNSEAGNGDEGKTFTQAELDRIVSDRLRREASKYADYEELKAQADKLAEYEAANKSEVDKLREETDRLKRSNAEIEAKALRAEVAMAKGLKPSQARRLQGATKDELEADADEMIAEFAPASSDDGGDDPDPVPGRPVPNLRGGADPTQGAEPDIREIVDSIPRSA